MMNETNIIRAILGGDTDRYAALVERYHKGLIIHCEQLVKDRADAEDIAQDAFIKAFERLSAYDPERSRFSTWLYKIATNKALDHLRKHSRQLHPEDIELLAEATMPVFIEEEEKAALRRAVRELTPPEYRHVIEAYYWQGKSYQQIAHDTHHSVNTIGTWMHRAKLQLKEKLS